MHILSLSFGHDGSAAVFRNGKLACAIATERLTRFKKQRGVTSEVIQYVLDAAGLKWTDIHLAVITNWFYDRDGAGRELFDKAAAQMAVTMPNGQPLAYEFYAARMGTLGHLLGPMTFLAGADRLPCVLLDHHFAHCAYAYYMSPFEDSLVVSVDAGDNFGSCHAVAMFNDSPKASTRLRRGSDFQPGVYYSRMTDFLGFHPALMDAGKVMALAAYGTPHPEVEEFVWGNCKPGDVFGGDMYSHTLARHGIRAFPTHLAFAPVLPGEGGIVDRLWLKKEDWNQELNRNIAATTQAALEHSLHNFLRDLSKATRHLTRNICLTGGTMLNCVSNGKTLHSGLFDKVFVAPACGDDGLAIGAGLFISDRLENGGPGQLVDRFAPRVYYTTREAIEGGRKYSAVEVDAAVASFANQLEQARVRVWKFSENQIVEFACEQIVNNRIVGWFHGGSEMGPRALGHRSILANPANPEIKNTLNSRVKHREEFRPFAPAVLREYADEWFDLAGNESPFMLFSVKCKKPAIIPSAVHVDNSARVQTVEAATNPRFYALLKALNERTGIPVVINTSFNVQGEPIVESPADAIRCFLGTQIDALVIEGMVLEKQG